MAKEYEKIARHRLWAINVINAGLEIKAPKASNQAGYGGAGDILSPGQHQPRSFRPGRFG